METMKSEKEQRIVERKTSESGMEKPLERYYAIIYDHHQRCIAGSAGRMRLMAERNRWRKGSSGGKDLWQKRYLAECDML